MKKFGPARAGRFGVAAALMLAMPIADGAMAQQSGGKPIAVAPPSGAPMSFADLIERVSPAVVSVIVTTEIRTSSRRQRVTNPFSGLPGFDEYEERFPNGQGEEDEGEPETDQDGNALGSGFFISSSGYIVTNHHVVEDAREVIVSLKGGDQLEAEIIGTDPNTDLAVIKVKKAGSYPYVQFATKARPRVGDWVVAVGNPFGLGGTATAGIVSADGRNLDAVQYNDFIQVDAPINRGNSGGPTFNLAGEVIGVNTAIFSESGGSVGIGFAIEAGAAKKITDTLIKDGKVVRGWLGVEIADMTERYAAAMSLKVSKGAIVRKVTAGGPAEAGGIRRSDVIIAVNNEEVKNQRDLTQRVGSLLAGSSNSFRILRGGREQVINVTVRERNDVELARTELDETRKGMPRPRAADTDTKVDGGTLRTLTTTEAPKFELVTPGTGLMVITVEPRGTFAKAQTTPDRYVMAPGDVILDINEKAPKSAKDYSDAIAAARSAGKKDIVLRMQCGLQERCGDGTYIALIEIKPE